jgi:hypothetical protein
MLRNLTIKAVQPQRDKKPFEEIFLQKAKCSGQNSLSLLSYL